MSALAQELAARGFTEPRDQVMPHPRLGAVARTWLHECGLAVFVYERGDVLIRSGMLRSDTGGPCQITFDHGAPVRVITAAVDAITEHHHERHRRRLVECSIASESTVDSGGLADTDLARVLADEDDRENRGVLDADDRRTCHSHQDWYAHCWPSPLHANRVTGHNWCRTCDQPLANCPHRPTEPTCAPISLSPQWTV